MRHDGVVAVKVFVAACAAVLLAVPAAVAGAGMSVAQQNELVRKYCAVCHDDAHVNGGLSLERFDAAHPDPGVAAMLVSKLKAKAMGAAGLPLPDQATQDALETVLRAESAGAHDWTIGRPQSPTAKGRELSASIVRELPSSANGGEPDLYRLILTCDLNTRRGSMELAWSPGVPPRGQVMSAAADATAPKTYKIEGSEKLFPGTTGTSGTGATLLATMPLPVHELRVSDVFPGETVVFPIDALPETIRRELGSCFAPSSARR